MSHYVHRNLQATEISKLELIKALYVVYIWLTVFILVPYTLSSLRLDHFMTKLEILDKAQRESARRPKSDWKKLGREVKKGGRISPASKSRGPNSNALAYAERALST